MKSRWEIRLAEFTVVSKLDYDSLNSYRLAVREKANGHGVKECRELLPSLGRASTFCIGNAVYVKPAEEADICKDNALRILGIAPVLLLILFSRNVQAQSPDSLRFDLLKCFRPGQKLVYSYDIGVFFHYLPDTVSTVSTFGGTREIGIDSIRTNAVDSTRVLFLTICTKGTEVIRTSARVVDSRPIDSTYSSTIAENEGIVYRAGAHKITGWIFPYSLSGYSRRCSYDSTEIFYPYLSYFRYYDCPSSDTFDVRNDTLNLRTLYTDCYDFAYEIDYYVTLDSGLVHYVSYMFNWFDYDWWADLRLVEITEVKGSPPVPPPSFTLSQNYPNPFNPTTTVAYSVPVRSNIRLTVYDILGRRIRTLVDGMQSPGEHRLTLDSTGLASGTYLLVLETPQGVLTSKIALIK